MFMLGPKVTKARILSNFPFNFQYTKCQVGLFASTVCECSTILLTVQEGLFLLCIHEFPWRLTHDHTSCYYSLSAAVQIDVCDRCAFYLGLCVHRSTSISVSNPLFGRFELIEGIIK